MARASKLTEKDMSVLREGDHAFKQVKSNHSMIKDYSLQHRVKVMWNLNEEANRDAMFKLQVDDYEVILDAEEVMRVIRFV